MNAAVSTSTRSTCPACRWGWGSRLADEKVPSSEEEERNNDADYSDGHEGGELIAVGGETAAETTTW